MIISGGFNVYPRAIEEAIYEHSSVAEVSASASRTARGEAAGRSCSPPVLQLSLPERAPPRRKLGRHEMPAHLEFRDALPTPSALSKKN
jgi:long-chain acyl-CoA synthetase